MRNTFAGLAISFATLLLTLGGLELLFRLFSPQDAVLWVDSELEILSPNGLDSPYRGDPDLGLMLVPDVHYRNTAPEFSIDVRANSDGYRAPEFSMLSGDGRPRIVVTGDSFAWGHGVDVPDRVTDLLAGKIPDYAWLNLAVPGTGTDQHLLHFRKNGIRLAPSLVVEFVYPNDLVDNLRSFRYFPKPRFELHENDVLKYIPVPPAAAPPRRPFLPLDRFFRNRSHLYVFVKGRATALRTSAGKTGERTEDVIGFYRKDRDPSMKVAMNLLTAELSLYAREVRATGAQFAIVVVPHKWEMGTRGRYVKDDWGKTVKLMGLRETDYDLEAFHRELMKWAEVEEVPVLGLLPYLRSRETGDTYVYFSKDGHWSPAGNRIVADLFVSQLWSGLSARLDTVLAGAGETGEKP